MRRSLLPSLLVLAACGNEPTPTPVTPAPAPERPLDVGCADAPASDVAWTLLPRSDGALELRADTTPLLVVHHGGFRAPGKSARPTVRRLPGTADTLAFEVGFEALPVTLRATASIVDPTHVRIDYVLDASQPLRGIPGVGLQFDLESHAWALPPDALQIHAGRDLRVELPELGTLEATFSTERTAPRTARDTHKPSRARSAWLEGDSPVGTTEATLTLTLPGPVTLAPALEERYAGPPKDRWHRDPLVYDDWPVDLRHLNAAHGRAGSHGRVLVDGDRLRFEDGTPARFWGTNLAASALFEADDATITRQAQRLSALGFNLVRLHHHDAAWIDRNVFDTRDGTTQRLSPAALDRLDRWIDTLAQEGIYVWIDLHTGRQFLPGDAIPGYADMLSGPHPRQARGFPYINHRVEALLEGFAEAYLRRKNPYTGHRWADEPAVLATLLTNENDLTQHFGVAFRPETGRETHVAMFEAQARGIIEELGLPKRALRSVHRPGPGKVLLAEMQHRWDSRALAHLRGLGVRTPAVTTNFWGQSSLFSLAPLAVGDTLDVHSYGRSEALSGNPHRVSNWIHAIATAQLAGKPLTVSEWAVPKPNDDRFTAAPWVAAIGSLQGWDALLSYCYAQTPLGHPPKRASAWGQHVDPAQLGLSPTAALMFRRGDVAPARETVALAPSVEAVWNSHASPKTRAALRTLPERSRMVVVLPDRPELDWDVPGVPPEGTRVVRDLDTDFLPPSGTEVQSDTGEITRDWAAGVLRIDTPNTQVASGWLGGETVELGALRVTLQTPKATVAAIALDDAPLHRSSRILVTVVARAEPDPDGHVRSEPISGEFALRTQGARRLIPLGPRSRARDVPAEAPGIPGVVDGAWTRFQLPETGTHWFLVSP